MRLIDKEELIKSLGIPEDMECYHCGWNAYGKCIRDGLSDVCFSIENAEEVGRWIPCSERLPEKPKPNPDLDGKPLDLYLVCAKGDTPFRAFWNGKTFTDGWFCLTTEVDAWMPLPEPWRGGEDGNQTE